MGTDTIYRGTFWVQTRYTGGHFGYKTNFRHLKKTLYPLKCLASPDLPFSKVANFPYALTKHLGQNQDFGIFLQKFAPAGTKKSHHFLKDFMQNFSLHVTGPVSKNRHWFC